MTIDLKWFLPFVIPFMLLLPSRLLWFVAGAEWNTPEKVAAVCLVLGSIIGLLAVFIMEHDKVYWRWTLFNKEKE